MSAAEDSNTLESEKKKVQYCDECRRIVGIGCDCGLSFSEKLRGVSLTVPPGFGYR